MEDEEILAIFPFEADCADAGLFAEFFFDAYAAGLAADAVESAPELLGVSRLVDVVGTGDADQGDEHREGEEMFSHGDGEEDVVPRSREDPGIGCGAWGEGYQRNSMPMKKARPSPGRNCAGLPPCALGSVASLTTPVVAA